MPISPCNSASDAESDAGNARVARPVEDPRVIYQDELVTAPDAAIAHLAQGVTARF